MKRNFKYIAYPLTLLLSVALNIIMFVITPMLFISFSGAVSILIYAFLGGYAVSKIDSKRALAVMLAVMSVIAVVAGVICAKGIDWNSDTWAYYAMLLSPLGATISFTLTAGNLEFSIARAIITGICFIIPIVISYLSALVFRLDKKTAKKVFAIITALLCAALSVRGVYSFVTNLDETYYDMNGEKYVYQSDVKYYDKAGNVYTWTYNDDSGEDSLYSGELTDKDGREYDIEKAYVYTDGYIFIDDKDEVEFRDDLPSDVTTDWDYIDKDGNICAKVSSVSYNKKGEPWCVMGDEYRTKQV